MKDLIEEMKVTNGFNTTQLGGLIENLKENPNAGNITFSNARRIGRTAPGPSTIFPAIK